MTAVPYTFKLVEPASRLTVLTLELALATTVKSDRGEEFVYVEEVYDVNDPALENFDPVSRTWTALTGRPFDLLQSSDPVIRQLAHRAAVEAEADERFIACVFHELEPAE